jgi:RNA polymerase sigma-70 factor (ECF subfamily)
MADETEQIIDEILVMDAQTGRVEALEALVSRWQKRLWRYACHLTGRTDAAWDVTQEGWLGIVRGIRRLHDPAHFKAWAYRIVTNKANDWIGRERRRAQARSKAPEPVATACQTLHTDVSNDVRDLLNRLSDRSRTVLTLHYIEGFRVAEVAGILRIAPGTVKSRLHSARMELKRLWQEHGEE